jgi:nitrogen fixation/metabolism regulation signal transduction histidine kinase
MDEDWTPEIVEANTKLICKAVNAHKPMVKTFKKILDRLSRNPMSDDELAKVCREAIATAEKQP